ncbi:Protein of unknown function [Lactobacillus helveticus CIRM-BIA 101]|uniref:Uncharacterized protein n=1 Tax=Lactobacillus helveticus CIRM-BIA 104 TaxID=1226333 RepID=U6FBQ8_LACHE|nr:hypothetical protein [Lactobacillus helveticus]CDI60011.1 Protein of unknown function [Lactobacillus helveticus CIRM-BIA 104]CDI63358.1 Protein of unknown function [Lactobacillus helveticus CIRM-BIA 103]CDI65274.1 Protein of unknown function [Lactobacillus helveticus CIRM-BIA 101]
MKNRIGMKYDSIGAEKIKKMNYTSFFIKAKVI